MAAARRGRGKQLDWQEKDERDPDAHDLEDPTTMLDERFSRRRKRDLDEEVGDLPDEPPPGWCDY